MAAWLLLAATLAGCPASYDELLDKSRILGVAVSPSPVPAPGPEGPARFTISVDVDSNEYTDRLDLWWRDPAHNGDWQIVSSHGICDTVGLDSCGLRTVAIACWNAVSTAPGVSREITCGPGGLQTIPGTYRWRVTIDRCTDLSFSCESGPQDTREFDVTIR